MIPPEALALAISRCWPNLQTDLTESDWKRFSGRLLTLLRQLDDETVAGAPIIQAIQALFDEFPTAASSLAAAVRSVEPPELRTAGGSRSALETPFFTPVHPPMRCVLKEVLYGTDRAPTSAAGEPIRYGSRASEHLSFGSATVSIPDDHKKGRLERPCWYRVEFREDRRKHVLITALNPLTLNEFVGRARELGPLEEAEDEALIFVHGYHVSFEDCVRRTGQFAVDVEFPGIAIAYSWPSAGRLIPYAADANASEVSMFGLANFISIVRSSLGLSRIHVVAHSMGSRLLARALDRIAVRPQPDPQACLHQVVFAAPDIDPRTFLGFAEEFTRHCVRCTLYASSGDLALAASRLIYRSQRAGAAAGELFVHGVDSIDASRVDQSLTGHSYFAEERSVLNDLNALLKRNEAPGDRFGLTEVAVPDGRYWIFEP